MVDQPRRDGAKDAPARPGIAVSGETPLGCVLAAVPEMEALLARLRPADTDQRAWDDLLASVAGEPLRNVAMRIGLPLPALIATVTGILPAGCDHGRAEDVAEAAPPWLAAFDADRALKIDVRPMIAAGTDPFRAVMALAERVPPEGSLIIEAPFDPTPLRRVLARLGFDSHASVAGNRHVCIRCRRMRAPPSASEGAVRRVPGEVWQGDDGLHIDVRGLAPPRPMTAILTLIDHGAHQGTIIVHHDREPIYLLPELAERGWTHAYVAGDPGEVRLVLRPDPT